MLTHAEILPNGVELFPLLPHADQRGVLTEIFRESWTQNVRPVQWNVVHSAQNVLRGFHAHWQHTDYLIVVSGSMFVGMKDLRPDSSSNGKSASVILDSSSPSAILLPPGVGHAFYSIEPSVHIYAVSHYWNPEDELGCRWDDPELEIHWPTKNPILSDRDQELPDLKTLIPALTNRLLQKSNHVGKG